MVFKLPISGFTKKVISTIRKIPSGKVATYKQLAELSGKEHASRGVAWILHSCSNQYNLPWHRVLSSQGKISFSSRSSNFREQKRRLQREGVDVRPNGTLNLEKFQWKRRFKKKKPGRLQPKMFS